MFHLTNTLLKGPSMMNPVAQNNPNFMASMMGAMSQNMKEQAKPPNFKQPGQGFPAPMETRDQRKEMRGPTMDSNLFNGTPLATNHPNAINNYQQPPPPPQRFYEQSPIDDDDRFSVASSSDSSLSSLSTIPKKINIPIRKNKSKIGGMELNIS
jgi:hypothetical protein